MHLYRAFFTLTNDISFDALKSCGGPFHISKHWLHWTFQEFLAFKGLGEWQKNSKKTVFPKKIRKIVGFSKKKTHFSFSRDESNSEVSESLAYGKWEKKSGTRFSGAIPKCTFLHNWFIIFNWALYLFDKKK